MIQVANALTAVSERRERDLDWFGPDPTFSARTARTRKYLEWDQHHAITVTVIIKPLGRDIHVRISPDLPDLPDALLAEIVEAISHIPISPADRLRAIHDRSNLTWSQLARLLGVSRRAVHAWVGGSRMSAANLERLGRVEQFVSACYEATPQATRDRLFSSPPGELSPFATLLAEVSEARPISEPRAWAERNDIGED